MTHCVTVQIEVTDADIFAQYLKGALEPITKYGGTMVAGGPNSEVLEDTGAGATRQVLLGFPSAYAVKAYMSDPEFEDLYTLRRQGAKVTMMMLPPAGA